MHRVFIPQTLKPLTTAGSRRVFRKSVQERTPPSPSRSLWGLGNIPFRLHEGKQQLGCPTEGKAAGASMHQELCLSALTSGCRYLYIQGIMSCSAASILNAWAAR